MRAEEIQTARVNQWQGWKSDTREGDNSFTNQNIKQSFGKQVLNCNFPDDPMTVRAGIRGELSLRRGLVCHLKLNGKLYPHQYKVHAEV